MFGTSTSIANDTKAQPAAPGRALPKLALRQRSHDHPMIMFGMVVSAAFISMVLLPMPNAAIASVETNAVRFTGEPLTTAKGERLPVSAVARACNGQAWGNETMDCLAVIAREGRDGDIRKVRLIANAAPAAQTPNIF